MKRSKTDTRMFLHRDLPALKAIENASAYRVGVLAGDAAEGYLRQRLGSRSVVAYETYEAMMSDVVKGGIRVFAADTESALFHINSVLQVRYSNNKGYSLLFLQNRSSAAAFPAPE